jgi:hypothetical protein
MALMAAPKHEHDMDERVAIPLDPETALRALMRVDPKQIDNDERRGRDAPATDQPSS